MRNNKILGVAIAAFSLPVGVAQADTVGFQNVGSSIVNEPVAGFPGDKILSGAVTSRKIGSTGFDTLFNTDVVDVPSGGITYATDVLGGSASAKLPKTKRAAVVYTISATSAIERESLVTFTLSEGVFAEDPELAIADQGKQYTTTISINKGGKGSPSVVFRVPATNSKPLDDGDQLLLVYQFEDAPSLKAEDGTVELTAKLLDSNDDPVNPERTVSIATSKSALTAELSSEDTGTIHISTLDGSKFFKGSGAVIVNPDANKKSKVVRIGYLKITNKTGTKESDGETDFLVGTDPGDGKIQAGTTQLKITGGQFDASVSAKSVYLYYAAASQEIARADAVDDVANTATFDLTDAELTDLRTVGGGGKSIDIRLEVDGTTEINTVENRPEATLTLDFAADYVTDVTTGPTALRQIGKDGMVCVLYNVPGVERADEFNVRIINESNSPGKFTGKMYLDNGTINGPTSGIDLTGGQPLAAGATMHLNAEDLETLGFPRWSKRAILEITATLPKFEALVLMRSKATGIPTNVSVGASGSGCSL